MGAWLVQRACEYSFGMESVWLWLVSGGGTLLGFEAARWPVSMSFWGVGAGGVAGPPWSLCSCWSVVVGVGLFLENCIVDASIFVSN